MGKIFRVHSSVRFFDWKNWRYILLLDYVSDIEKKSRWVNVFMALYPVSRWILGIVFVYASYDKILDPKAFAEVIYNYQILPDILINICALVLPWLELALGICLIMGLMMPGTVLMVNLLLILFIGALFFNLYRGLDVSCGCFSTALDDRPVDIWTVARDASFLLLSFHLFICIYCKKLIFRSFKRSSDSGHPRIWK